MTMTRPGTPDVHVTAVAPPPELRFRRPFDLHRFLRELWRARGLMRTLTERDLRARYKQAMLGVAWAFIGPVGFAVVFSVFFNHVAKVPTGNVPYILFSYTGLIPWGFFAGGVVSGATAVMNNMVLLNKVPCPREVFPISAIVTALVDAAISALVLPIMFLVTGRAPQWASLWFPIVFIVHLAITLGWALLLAGVLMYVRDVRHGLPLLMQLLLFATPVGYALSSVPSSWVNIYCFLNPIAPVIDNYRRTILYGFAPDWPHLGLAAAHGLAVLLGGYALFKRIEPGFADVA